MWVTRNKEILDKAKPINIEAATDAPNDTISVLITLYARTPHVAAAYLVRCREPSHPEQSTLLIALVGSGDLYQVMCESSGVIRDTYSGPDVIDMVQMPDRDEDMGTHVRAIGVRFSDRAWGERISDAFGGTHH